jgi:hypothetical protein
VTGATPRSQTVHEYAALLTGRLAAMDGAARLRDWVVAPARVRVQALTQLYAASLFSSRPAGQGEARAAARNWSGLWWRLALLNVLLALRSRAGRQSGTRS